MNPPQILIAGVGNIFHGDDGFGVEVAGRLQHIDLPDGVRVVDFGIRAFDLACALQGDYDAVILVDAMSQGGEPGTVYVVEPELDQPGGERTPLPMNPHGLNPTDVIRWVKALRGTLPRIIVVGCEPAVLGSEEDVLMALSKPVQAAVEQAVATVCSFVSEMAERCTS